MSFTEFCLKYESSRTTLEEHNAGRMPTTMTATSDEVWYIISLCTRSDVCMIDGFPVKRFQEMIARNTLPHTCTRVAKRISKTYGQKMFKIDNEPIINSTNPV